MWRSFWRGEAEEREMRMRIVVCVATAFAEREWRREVKRVREGEGAQKQVAKMSSWVVVRARVWIVERREWPVPRVKRRGVEVVRRERVEKG